MGIIGSAFVGYNRVYGIGENRGFIPTSGLVMAASPARRLVDSYTGPLIRVREDGGDAEQDIGFDSNGDLDTASLLSFCGSNMGYVKVIYNQIGTNHVFQTSFPDQPYIVNNGVLETSNGKPAIEFDSGDEMYSDKVVNNIDDKTVFVNFETIQSNGGQVLDLDNDAVIAVLPANKSYAIFNRGNAKIATNGASYLTTAGTAQTPQLMSVWQDGVSLEDAADFKMYINGTYIPRTSGTAGDILNGNGKHFWGYSRATQTFLNGYLQDTLIYDTALSDANRSGIETNINQYYSIY
jgi:hypothetical protein